MKLQFGDFRWSAFKHSKLWQAVGLGVGLLLSGATLSRAVLADSAREIAQAHPMANPTPNPTASPTPNPTADPTTDPNTGFTGVQIPYTAIKPVDGRVRIHFINETGSAVDYQVIGDTGFRSLAGRSEMTLEKLRLPATFTFRRADNGFLQVALDADSTTGTLTLRVRETADFGTDRTSVYVDQSGRVYLN